MPACPRSRSPARAPAALLGLCLALAALTGLPPARDALAQASPGTTRDAQRRLEAVRRELREVAAERRRLEGERGAASRALRAADERVAALGRDLGQTERLLAAEQAALAGLERRRQALRADQAGHRRALAALLRAAHRDAGGGALQALLSQDRVADAGRRLAYHGYLQRERSRRSAALAAELRELDTVEAGIRARRAALDAARAARREQLAALDTERRSRAATLGELEQRYADRQARERALGSDAKALQTVVSQLRAAAARAAAERAAAERAAARDAQRAESAARSGAKPRSGGSRPPARTPKTVASAAPVRVGGLGWPASGDLLAGYGARMPDGRSSSGLLIAASAGSPVRAVADGQVVFGEWMTGYGLILIVDHGNGYLSLYAHTESLLKNPGDAVKRGETVARVGSSGGQARPALYFELRRNGQPVDPRQWLSRQ